MAADRCLVSGRCTQFRAGGGHHPSEAAWTSLSRRGIGHCSPVLSHDPRPRFFCGERVQPLLNEIHRTQRSPSNCGGVKGAGHATIGDYVMRWSERVLVGIRGEYVRRRANVHGAREPGSGKSGDVRSRYVRRWARAGGSLSARGWYWSSIRNRLDKQRRDPRQVSPPWRHGVFRLGRIRRWTLGGWELDGHGVSV